MPTYHLSRCNTKIAGIARGDDGATYAVYPTNGADIAEVQWINSEGTVTSTVLKVRFGGSRNGPWADYASGATLNSLTKATDLLAVRAAYLAVEVTTGEGSDVYIDLITDLRRSQVDVAVTA
jgi:hypothetical protein